MEENKKISLDSIGKDLPFTVPENYFEDFAVQMDAQVSGKVVSVKRMVRSWLYMAAMFVGILLIGRGFYSIYQNKMENTEKIEQYILSQIDDATLLDFYLEEFDYDE